MMRLLQAAGFIAVLMVVFFVSARLLPEAGAHLQTEIRIVSRLDEYTRKSHPTIANTIPTFLAQPGQLGAIAPEAGGGPDDAAEDPAASAPELTTQDVRPVNEVELQKGFCTATLVTLVRQQYPGSYDNIPDADLEKTLLETRPEYRDRVCVLPVWIDADPRDIIKYEVGASALGIGRTRLMFAGIITAVFGLAGGAVVLKFRH